MNRMRTGSLQGTLCAIAVALLSVGCHVARQSAGTGFVFTTARPEATPVSDWALADTERAFDNAVAVLASTDATQAIAQKARDAERARNEFDPLCVELYADVALACWPQLSQTPAAQQDELAEATWTAYHYSVAQLVRCAKSHGRLDPAAGILAFDDSSTPIPITHHAFPWRSDDFNELKVVAPSSENGLARYWTASGLGVPLVAVRTREKSDGALGRSAHFSATAILRPLPSNPAASDGAEPAGLGGAVLELHDPLRVQRVAYQHGQWDLARDISAPLNMASATVEGDKFWNFFIPGRKDDDTGLRMVEPYQPGKIPVVMVHGLLSDKLTWLDLANDLRSVPGFNDRFQIWSFQYATGEPFVRSAAEMRRELAETVRKHDPQGSDPALSHIVLIGHSMGGLVSKLQITGSDSELWDSVAKRSIEDLDASPEIRREIETMFFFEPLPIVKRVIFVGSPHQGSQMAQGFLGKLGSALVVAPLERASMLEELVTRNPNVFPAELTERMPTSIEFLRPDNPVLLATYKLRVNPSVRMHTIIGTRGRLADGTPADGVVAVASARHPGTVSERQIDATHIQLTSHPETTLEVVRILKEHLRSLEGGHEVVAGRNGASPDASGIQMR